MLMPSSQDRLSLGLYHPTGDLSALEINKDALDDFTSILSAGGSDTTVVPNIQLVKFVKNMWNVVFGGSAALMRSPLAEVFRPQNTNSETRVTTEIDKTNISPSYEKTSQISSAAPLIAFNTIPLFYEALSELQSLGRALFPSSPEFGQDVAFGTLQRTSVANSQPHSTHRASMLADIENGRPMEVEVILGEVVRMARAKGLALPVSVDYLRQMNGRLNGIT